MPWLPACFPATKNLLLPTVSGLIGSYVDGISRTPCTCMPDSWPNAFSPTIALFGGGYIPVSLATRREVSYISSGLMPSFLP
jgi:hypothetical protein